MLIRFFFNTRIILVLNAVQDQIEQLSLRISDLETVIAKKSEDRNTCHKPPANQPVKKEDDEDDDVDLFGSDSEEETEAAAKIRDERLAAYNAKKSKSNTK